jgi:hypothetical protein
VANREAWEVFLATWAAVVSGLQAKATSRLALAGFSEA